ncbi:hypothetical protein CHUAL_007887 [Chamberlinius hualienensis]
MTQAGLFTKRLIILTIVLIALCSIHVNGLRGCANFGHACFGAHGKRTGSETYETQVSDNSNRYEGYDTPSMSLAKGITTEDNRSRRIPANFLRILRNMMRNLESGQSMTAMSAEALAPSERI